MPLAKYYDLPLYGPAPRERELIERACPIDPKLALEAGNWLDLLKTDGYNDCEFGYCMMPDGTGYIANYTTYPNCTPQMLAWWFRWLNVPTEMQPRGPLGFDNLKYKLWNPADHVGHGFVNGKDKWDGIWTVESLDLGAGEPKRYTIRHPVDLKKFGLTDEKEAELHAAGCFVDCSYITFYTPDEEKKPLPGSHLTITLSRMSPWGYMEKCSREWIGYWIKDGKIAINEETPPSMLCEDYMKKILIHNVVEAQQLSLFLADLYRDYHEKPDNAD